MKHFYLTKKINTIVSTILILLGLKEESVGLTTTTTSSSVIHFDTRNRFGLYSFKAAMVFLLFASMGANAQLTGTTVTMSGTAISGSPFSSLAAAITAVNGLTVTGPVVVTCGTGTETAPIAGYSITKTGTSVNTITIQGNGAANTIITAYSPQASGVKSDAIFFIFKELIRAFSPKISPK